MSTATIKFRRGPAALWVSINPTLGAGEPGYEIDTGKVKIGNGTDHWNDLDYLDVNAEPPIAAPGSNPTSKYLRGDKTWQDLATDPLLSAAYGTTLAAFKDAVMGEGFRPNGAPTRDSTGLVTGCAIAYPDGSTGTYTVTSTDANNAVIGFTATTTGGPVGTKTATVTIPRDSTGQVNGAIILAVA
jgi:hypothetical protein